MTRIPLVQLCDVMDCGFNEGRRCHAAAIQVGHALAAGERAKVTLQDPRCDTYTARPQAHLGAPDFMGQIGSCKVETCDHNDHFRCTADAIQVGLHESHADCRTYKPRV